jgi:precorrin-6A/cobalt-precorrin-6A reductase
MCNPLILGGTTEATALANAMAGLGLSGVFSYAGRVARPKSQPLPTRIGGFGGVHGLCRYLQDHAITHVIDATHPFASQMSHNAIAACEQANVPLIALTRPAWSKGAGDNWRRVPDIAAAAAALGGGAQTVMLAVGRMHLDAFAGQPQHRYVLRLVDAPDAGTIPFPNATVIVDQGPFTVENDRALMVDHGVDLIVSKNAGGTGAQAKITAARDLGIPVVMIDRPVIVSGTQGGDTSGRQVGRVSDVLAWLGQ